MNNKNDVNKYITKGKIIRDSIHGDIFVPIKFLEIIDTPEFQRLRRIKQLSVANVIFPSADHTRYSHSLGTFYIMNLMIEHFEKNFDELNISIEIHDKEIALLAALLHDIGHGPFSHAFENVHPEHKKNINHEVWTTKIIESKESTINRVIIKNFGIEAPNEISNLIRKQRKVKKEKKYELTNIDLFSVLSSLISSQLDADRLDYLLRDSANTGVTFGRIDISRIISSLQVTVYKNKYYVCIPEKYLQDIEAYLLARYQMLKVVYNHDFKIQMEQIIKLILKKAYELFNNDKLIFCSSAIKKFFSSSDLDIKDYVTLDDSTFISAFQEWSLSDDLILAELCKVFLNRDKSNKINALDNSNSIIIKFKKDVCALFEEYGYSIKNLEQEYFWIESSTGFSIYNINKENIWIQRNNGLIVDISKVSKIVKVSKDEEIIWKDNRNIIFINYNIIKRLHIKNLNNLIEDLKKVCAKYDIRKNIEIEKKYHFRDITIFAKVKDYLINKTEYKICFQEEKEQIDYYYDTDNYMLKDHNATLRTRKKDNKYELTIKTPIEEQTENEDQIKRFEYSKQILDNNINCELDFVLEHLSFLEKNSVMKPSLIIKNYRTPINLTFKNISFEMVYDKVKYENFDRKSISDFQIEIELKSDYSHSVNLKILTDELEQYINGLTSSKISKYIRGLELLSK